MDVRHDTRFVLSMNVPLRNIVDCSVISSRQVHDERKANITKSKLVSIQSMGNSTVGLNGRDEGLIVIAIVTEIQMIDAHGRREQKIDWNHSDHRRKVSPFRRHNLRSHTSFPKLR